MVFYSVVDNIGNRRELTFFQRRRGRISPTLGDEADEKKRPQDS